MQCSEHTDITELTALPPRWEGCGACLELWEVLLTDMRALIDTWSARALEAERELKELQDGTVGPAQEAQTMEDTTDANDLLRNGRAAG